MTDDLDYLVACADSYPRCKALETGVKAIYASQCQCERDRRGLPAINIAELLSTNEKLTAENARLREALAEIDAMPEYTTEMAARYPDGLFARYHRALKIARAALTQSQE